MRKIFYTNASSSIRNIVTTMDKKNDGALCVNRRHFLKSTGMVAVGFLAGTGTPWSVIRADNRPLPGNGGFASDLDIELRAAPDELGLLPGNPTRVWRYAGRVISGDPRRFFLAMAHMQWTINNRSFQMEAVADDEVVKLDTQEIWEFDNSGDGMGMMRMMDMPHPIHLHGKQFRVLSRRGVSHAGYVDDGWKDTVLLMPGEQIRIRVDFRDYPGLFLYHCHNLEHEDMGMMRNYYISA
ncbi:MAG: multicopper oxidase domain-containing protein [Desulfobacteraceae bacterium]|nr:multicopper oxidase domain-containing protein [Desulfobacteraceae bacterium]